MTSRSSCARPARWRRPSWMALLALLKADGRLVEHNQRLALADAPGHCRRRTMPGACRPIETTLSRWRHSTRRAGRNRRDAGVLRRSSTRCSAILCRTRTPGADRGPVLPPRCGRTGRGRSWSRSSARKAALESVKFKYLLDTTRKYAFRCWTISIGPA